ncbi:MAG TPA: signal peptidase I [Clostridia bacterium]|nr:signal peptidase I [Clostridia bacterium]
MKKHVQKLLNHQRDILSPQALEALSKAIQDLDEVVAKGAEKEALKSQMTALEEAANKWLKPYPHAAWRENVEVLLVALAVAMAIRTFFVQPFKIPTGSMQPTLFGVTSVPDYSRGRDPLLGGTSTNLAIPTGWERIREWFQGVSYIHIVADADGTLQAVNPPVGPAIFKLYQTLVVGGKSYTIWFPPDYGGSPLHARAGLELGQFFRKGEDILRMRVVAGDHLFVNRMTYNFRPPQRGEIIVFETKGIERLQQDQFYIKRLIALGNEKVQIGDDRHVIIDGTRLDASTPHFKRVYGFDPKEPVRRSHYSGHLNETMVKYYCPSISGRLAPNFPDQSTTYLVQTNHYMVMGDNTLDSFDSRGWGDFPAARVIGSSFFVYWPITDRFGWGYNR